MLIFPDTEAILFKVISEKETVMNSSPSVTETYRDLKAKTLKQERECKIKFGRPMVDFVALDEIRREPGSPLNTIARRMGMTNASFTMVVNRLLLDQLVHRIPNIDRRVVALELTEAGEFALDRFTHA